MTTRSSHHAAALALALATTLAIFSGIGSLSTPVHPGAVLATAHNSSTQA